MAFDRQKGSALPVVAGLLVVVGASMLNGYLAKPVATRYGQQTATAVDLKSVSDALVRFATVNRRLPCPASAAAGTTGLEAAAGSACTFPNGAVDGIVPWVTLGIPRELALDPWGQWISYRVYTDATGFTRPDGLHGSNCNTYSTPLPTNTTPIASGFTGCLANHSQAPATSLYQNFGLTVIDPVTATNMFDSTAVATGGAAFVLISHGASGRGGYTSAGQQRLPVPANTSYEWPNVNPTVTAASTYVMTNYNHTDSNVTADTHFDDIVLAMNVAELLTLSQNAPRNWGAGPGVAPPPPPPPDPIPVSSDLNIDINKLADTAFNGNSQKGANDVNSIDVEVDGQTVAVVNAAGAGPDTVFWRDDDRDSYGVGAHSGTEDGKIRETESMKIVFTKDPRPIKFGVAFRDIESGEKVRATITTANGSIVSKLIGSCEGNTNFKYNDVMVLDGDELLSIEFLANESGTDFYIGAITACYGPSACKPSPTADASYSECANIL